MRGIEEFTKELAMRLQAKMEGVEITPMDNLKNNGVVAHGLTIRRVEENIAPTLYVENWFEQFKRKQLSVDDILEQIVRTYQELDTPNIPDMKEYLSSPELINRINLRLLNWEANRKLIADRQLVHYPVPKTDLVVLFYIHVIQDGDTSGDIALSEAIRERYLPTFEDAEALYNEIINKVSVEEVRFESLSKLANRMLEEQGIEMPLLPVENDFLHVLTNAQKTYGACIAVTMKT